LIRKACLLHAARADRVSCDAERNGHAYGRPRLKIALDLRNGVISAVCTENLIRVDDVKELPKLAE
jgi:hypothetical protein